MIPQNHGTFWSVGEMRRLRDLAKSGIPMRSIARILMRSESACSVALRTMVKMEMYASGSSSDTLISWKKKIMAEVETV